MQNENFSPCQVERIFSNLDELVAFQKSFLAELEKSFNPENPEKSAFGKVFQQNVTQFRVYAPYCVNYGSALDELNRLESLPVITGFFEECRLRKNMQKLKLADFLLGPIQRICKYPLHLSELQKYTEVYHGDAKATGKALIDMKKLTQVRYFISLIFSSSFRNLLN